MPKFVYSRTLQQAGWNTTVVPAVVADEVRALATQPGGDLMVGGADLIESFRNLDLIDEYRLYLHPVLLGRGKPLFALADERTPLRLVENRTFTNGVVLLRYERVTAR